MAEKAPPELAGLKVEFTCNGRTTQETGRLMGAAALVVETSRVEAPDSPVELQFRPRPSSPLIGVKGFVSAQLSDGLRIHFTEISDEHRRHLIDLLFRPGAERRTTRRASLATQIRSVVGGQQIVGYTRDISAGGVFVETENVPARGTEVALRFRLAPDSPILEFRATVVYAVGGEGMGLRFWNLPPDIQQAIDDYIASQED